MKPTSPSPDESGEHVCVASVLACFAKGSASDAHGRIRDLPDGFATRSARDGTSLVAYRPRTPSPSDDQGPAPSGAQLLILGDDFEVEAPWRGAPMGNAAALEWSGEEGRLLALTSIPGLPALYLAEDEAVVVVTSDLSLLRCVEGLSLRFDPAGVSDLAHIGRPVGHRTLFSDVRIVPGGTRLTVRAGRAPVLETAWEPPSRMPCDSWEDYTAIQAEAFGSAIGRLDVSDSALSLSSGLDSRTTLAGLIAHGAALRCALTVSGENECLDARTASRLCAAYGIVHQTIKLDETFRRALPELSSRASLLSGGITSVWHAAQVHSYDMLGSPPPRGALSGYLGNQVGRRGTEGLTPRGTATWMLAPELTNRMTRDETAWYADAMQSDGFLETRFLIQQESTFGNLPGYAIGHSHAVQQSGYASRPLIENMWRMPRPSVDASKGSHVQNLRHLFFGEPIAESFQRRYINRVGGLVARYPVNWGWRSKGGVSIKGMALGGMALIDAIVSSRFAETPAAAMTRALRIAGLHEFRPVHEWLHRYMRTFVYDEALSRTSLDAGLFDRAALERGLSTYYTGGGQGFREIVLALDLALAARHFGATS